MPKPIWTGAVSFGLVHVPVKLVSAVSRKGVRFHQLHAEDGARIELRRFCTADGEEVRWDDLVKGYELDQSRHVVVRREELEALDPEATRTVEIEDFVLEEDIDPILYDSAYYLVPDGQAAQKAYALLRTAMERTGRVAVAKFVMRSKEHLAVVRPHDDALVLETMLFHDEVVPLADVEGLPEPDLEVSERELAMAEQLVESLSADWEPGKYEDEYRKRVLDLIERKAEGEEIAVAPEPEVTHAPVVDLAAALEASIEEAQRRESA
jgi:DNA end-binding protein Ku